LANGLVKRGFNLVSGGTDNHLMLVDLQSFGVTGKDLEKHLDEVNITVNKNAVPNDPQSPFVTSGVRIGTPAVTTRGLKTAEMELIAEYVYLAAKDFEGNKDKIKEGVKEICERFPLYK
jgi:glycine hydroxymethyltransferase